MKQRNLRPKTKKPQAELSTGASPQAESFSKEDTNLECTYQERFNSFNSLGVSQLSQLIIRRVVHSSSLPNKFRNQSVLRLLTDVAKQLTMNEIELTLMSIYLKKFGWKDRLLTIDYLLLYVAILAKCHINSDPSPYIEHLSTQIPDFKASFENWESYYSEFLEVSMLELNETFSELTRHFSLPDSQNIIDYNYYVDEILQSAPPYQPEFKDSEDYKPKEVPVKRKKQGKETKQKGKKPKQEEKNFSLILGPLHSYEQMNRNSFLEETKGLTCQNSVALPSLVNEHSTALPSLLSEVGESRVSDMIAVNPSSLPLPSLPNSTSNYSEISQASTSSSLIKRLS